MCLHLEVMRLYFCHAGPAFAYCLQVITGQHCFLFMFSLGRNNLENVTTRQNENINLITVLWVASIYIIKTKFVITVF